MEFIMILANLDNNEKVSFYSTEGMVLGSQKAIDGRVNYAVGTAQKIIIVKIGDNSIKDSDQEKEVIFDLNGRKLPALQKGWNIIKSNRKKTQKVYIK